MRTENPWKRKSGCHVLVQDLGSGFRSLLGLYEAYESREFPWSGSVFPSDLLTFWGDDG